jgi:hypothetical protein
MWFSWYSCFSSQVFSGPFLLSVRCRLSLRVRSNGSLPSGKHATAQSIVTNLHPPVRFLGHALGAGYALSIVLGSIRAEREVASLKIELARTFRRQAMMIFVVFTYRCIVSFASTNDLTHPPNDPLATISKVFFYLTQLPLELAICWNHASTDYRTVVDAGARGDLPRKARENGKKARKWPTTSLKNTIASILLRFRGTIDHWSRIQRPISFLYCEQKPQCGRKPPPSSPSMMVI